ncbi:MAG TPA: hypothetical protein PLE01_05420 [Syntrophothermus lipocalidus]|nr:hypothetical protein [Syntrophothermus lipocalidus]
MRKRRWLAFVTIIVLLLFIATGCTGGRVTTTVPTGPKTALASDFAPYREVVVDVNPRVPEYKVAPNLENITNRDRFKFSQEARKLLAANGFVVIPAQNPEFFIVYENNRYDGIPFERKTRRLSIVYA